MDDPKQPFGTPSPLIALLEIGVNFTVKESLDHSSDLLKLFGEDRFRTSASKTEKTVIILRTLLTELGGTYMALVNEYRELKGRMEGLEK